MLTIIQKNPKTSSQTSLQELYHRLEQAGFNRTFVQDYLLPDWWDDSLGENPTMRAVAEVGIARLIGVSIHTLHTPGAPLHPVMNFGSNVKDDQIPPVY